MFGLPLIAEYFFNSNKLIVKEHFQAQVPAFSN